MMMSPRALAARLVLSAGLSVLLLAASRTSTEGAPEAASLQPANGPRRIADATGAGTVAADSTTLGQDLARLQAQWRSDLGQLRDLRMRYQNADESQRREIARLYRQRIDAGEIIVERVTVAAIKAFQAKPIVGGEVAHFLADVAIDQFERGRFENVVRLSKILLDHGQPGGLELAAVSSFDCNDFDAAETYFNEAARVGKLSRVAAQIDDELKYYKQAWAEETRLRQAEAKADNLPRVKFQTEQGDIVLELFENEAPNTVANFIRLVEQGFYNGLTFYRVLPGRAVEGGSPNGDGTGGPGYCIRDEFHKLYRRHFRGSLSMYHQGKPDSGGSQFILTLSPERAVDGRLVVFGRVLVGMDVLTKLQRRDPSQPNMGAAGKIIQASVLRKRNHKYEFMKLPAS